MASTDRMSQAVAELVIYVILGLLAIGVSVFAVWWPVAIWKRGCRRCASVIGLVAAGALIAAWWPILITLWVLARWLMTHPFTTP